MEKYPLSKSGYRLYIECMSHQGTTSYCIPYCYTLDIRLDTENYAVPLRPS